MKYIYYRDNGGEAKTLRRYPRGEETGQRWEPNQGWVSQCAPRDCCLQTKDTVLSEEQAQAEFPGSIS